MRDALDRQRTYRRRRRENVVVVLVEVGPVEIEALRRLDLLGHDAGDKAAVTVAVQRFIGCAAAVAAIPSHLYR